jgi:hypothetical protein
MSGLQWSQIRTRHELKKFKSAITRLMKRRDNFKNNALSLKRGGLDSLAGETLRKAMLCEETLQMIIVAATI